jgi:hypothetical protein
VLETRHIIVVVAHIIQVDTIEQSRRRQQTTNQHLNRSTSTSAITMTIKAGARFFAFSVPKMRTITFLRLALCVAYCSAFLPVAPSLVSNCLSVDVVPSVSIRCTVTVTAAPLATPLFMAKPGMSDERARQEREAEIQSKISRMKREGRMKNKDGTAQSAEDSAMLEAEAFFSKPSPLRKFEKSQAERKRVEAEAAEAAAEEERKRLEDEPSESPDGIL